ncbi:hypothetical protein BOCO_0270 [Bombiscardovia coagulans]|uniref:Uncharacterized protein n=1 Tax=Bombiscardovia coagulans TaxID=686666 RepID=A0A261EUX7_9BIFI|nr:hypothetical protein BOCO_0270 [Bombiscardovia coagulans]
MNQFIPVSRAPDPDKSIKKVKAYTIGHETRVGFGHWAVAGLPQARSYRNWFMLLRLHYDQYNNGVPSNSVQIPRVP